MSGLDIEGVLAGHPGWSSWHETMFSGVECSGCRVNLTGCNGHPGRTAADRLHRAHVDAILRDRIADWLGSDEAVEGGRTPDRRHDAPEAPGARCPRRTRRPGCPSRVPGEET